MFVRFENVQKPNSYNDSPITSLSWMKHEPSLEGGQSGNERQPSEGSDLQSPLIPPHNHHFGHDVDNIDLNNNNYNNGIEIHRTHYHQQQQQQHQHHHGYLNRAHEDSISVSEDDSAKEMAAKDGWLAVGNSHGTVGVSYTTTKPYNYNKAMGLVNSEQNNNQPVPTTHRHEHYHGTAKHVLPQRTNYNLRGHRTEILFVRWNEPYQKLATCDENGVIFIWIKYEGRWSIELINDRNTRVTDIAWSHDGRMALICYMDGFVLVGSVSGQRYWSSMLNLNEFTITCGVWTPNDQHVLFGTSNGHILVISVHGNFVTQVVVQECVEISALTWSCGKFVTNSRNRQEPHEYRLAVSFVDGTVFVMKNYDDLDPKIISTELLGVKMEWSSDGQVLAVGGHRVARVDGSLDRFVYNNVLNFYSRNTLDDHSAPFPIPPINSEVLPFESQPLSALTWGNADRRLYVACGQVLFVGWVFLTIPSLSFLSRLKVFTCLKEESKVECVPVPEPIKRSITELFGQSICCYLPDYRRIRDFVFRPPPANFRLYCTLMRHEIEPDPGTIVNNGDSANYVLYLEYMGGLVPILKGKRSSKLKTEFIIFDPDMPKESQCRPPSLTRDQSRPNSATPSFSAPHNSSDSESEGESFAFPYLTPKTRRRLRCRSAQLRRYLRGQQDAGSMEEGLIGRRPSTPRTPANNRAPSPASSGSVAENLPEHNKIVLVASNIWSTKFKFLGLTPMLPSFLGSMTYRTSFLHLQPRQMELVIKELNTQNTVTKLENEHLFYSIYKKAKKNAYVSESSECSDSEESFTDCPVRQIHPSTRFDDATRTNTPAIAPMTPLRSVRNSMLLSTVEIPDVLGVVGQVQQPPVQPQEIVIPEPQVPSPPAEPEIQPPAQCPNNLESRISEECNSIVSRLANMNEEFLTLQINQSDYGRPTYSMEITTGAHNRAQGSREPEYYHSPEDQSPVDPSVPTSSSCSSVLPTMVRQFKHQSFQSESPKHVSYFRHQPLKSSVTKLGSPNISPSKNIRQKILKESPRKSSVSYCSSEFSAPAKSYIENTHHTTVCDNPVASLVDASKASPYKTLKYKSCSSEAYSATNSLMTSSPPMSFSAENTITSRGAVGPTGQALVFAPNSQSNILNDDLFKNVDEQSRPSSGLAAKSLSNSRQIQTYHIYDDTALFGTTCTSSGSQLQEVTTPTTATQRRRLAFRTSSKQSKSFDSPLKTPGDPLKDSFEQEENYLSNVEQVVKMLSDKLSAAAREKELQCNNDQMVASSSSNTKFTGTQPTSLSNNGSLIRRNSMPYGHIASMLSHKSTNGQNNSKNTSALQSESASMHSLNSESTAIVTNSNTTTTSVSRNNSLSRLWKNRSLPTSPRKFVQPVADVATPEASSTAAGVSSANTKRRSVGRHFFHSPNMMRKMRQKLSYLDCSSEEDNSSDDDDDISIDQSSTASQTPTRNGKPHKYRRSKHKHAQHDDGGTQFVLQNKAPLWNEVTQVYQLDFGGRVTQESAKNFQIEHQGRQVMQFGRIDKNAYTLDFEYPFSAVQALAVALANVTQRFK